MQPEKITLKSRVSIEVKIKTALALWPTFSVLDYTASLYQCYI